MRKLKELELAFIKRLPDLEKRNTTEEQTKLTQKVEHVMDSLVDAFVVSIKDYTKK